MSLLDLVTKGQFQMPKRADINAIEITVSILHDSLNGRSIGQRDGLIQ